MLKTAKFTFNLFAENTYVLWDDKTGETAVIDPGCQEPGERQQLKEFIDGRKLKLKFLINTHCHLDHILGLAGLRDFD